MKCRVRPSTVNGIYFNVKDDGPITKLAPAPATPAKLIRLSFDRKTIANTEIRGVVAGCAKTREARPRANNAECLVEARPHLLFSEGSPSELRCGSERLSTPHPACCSQRTRSDASTRQCAAPREGERLIAYAPSCDAIETAGAHVLDVPRYSLDLNPIEMAFSKPKTLLRKAAERIIAGLIRLI